MIEDLADDLTCILYKAVSCAVTLLIVDLLEAVDIADCNCKLKLFTAFFADLLIRLVLDVNISMLVLYACKSISVRHIDRRTDLGFVL